MRGPFAWYRIFVGFCIFITLEWYWVHSRCTFSAKQLSFLSHYGKPCLLQFCSTQAFSSYKLCNQNFFWTSYFHYSQGISTSSEISCSAKNTTCSSHLAFVKIPAAAVFCFFVVFSSPTRLIGLYQEFLRNYQYVIDLIFYTYFAN